MSITRWRVRRVLRACAGLLLLAVLVLPLVTQPAGGPSIYSNIVLADEIVACCLPDGTCQELTETACLTAGGLPHADGRDCSSVECATGACCLPDGRCEINTITECVPQGGIWQGAGTTCETDCPSGACWLPDGTCAVTTELTCTLQAGVWQGAETDCTSNPVPTGACCFVSGSPQQLSKAACEIASGYYAGDGTDAATYDCALGVCCMSGGCNDSPPLGTNPVYCERYAGGTWHAGVASCVGFDCSLTPTPGPTSTPVPTGACCLSDGSCEQLSYAQCMLQSGLYRADGIGCDEIDCGTGACCLADGSCLELSRRDCDAYNGTYAGAGTVCTQTNCAVGACCLADGSCSQLTESACGIAGGTYQGDNASCDTCPPPPATGACLLPSGGCTTLSQAACAGAFGIFLGDDSDCSTQNDPGACCLPDDSCVMTTTYACFLAEGSPQGPGVLCEDTYCVPPTGACCLEDGSCSELTEQACGAALGTWAGPETTCALTICTPAPVGACCLPNGECESLTAKGCSAALGTWQGADSDCASAGCVAAPMGACQLGTYTVLDPRRCIVTYEVVCDAAHGAYQGDDSVCTLESSTPVTITAAPAPQWLPASGPVTVTVQLQNLGDDFASVITMTADIPSLPNAVLACGGLPRRIDPNDNLICTTSGLPQGQPGTYISGTVTAIVMDGYRNVYEVQAELKGKPYELLLSKQDRQDPWYAGWNLGYDILLTNSGYLTLTQVLVTDTVPLPWSNVLTTTGGMTQAVWTIADLAPGTSRELEIDIQTRRSIPNRTILTNSVEVTALELAQSVTTTEETLFLAGPTPINSPTPAPSPTPRGYTLLPMILFNR